MIMNQTTKIGVKKPLIVFKRIKEIIEDTSQIKTEDQQTSQTKPKRDPRSYVLIHDFNPREMYDKDLL